jgi:hypothetical protein
MARPAALRAGALEVRDSVFGRWIAIRVRGPTRFAILVARFALGSRFACLRRTRGTIR